MTPGSAEGGDPGVPPVLVLGLGNPLLGDDGAGLSLLEVLAAEAWPPEIELVDGGTQGLALLGVLAHRRALLIVDAVGLGAAPGTVHVLRDAEVLAASPPGGGSAHEGNAGELLRAAALVGDLPRRLAVVGVEPAELRTRIGLSEAVAAAIPTAVARARAVIDELMRDG